MTSPPVARQAAEKKRTVKQTDRHRNWKFDEEVAYAEALSWVGEQLEARYVDPPAPPAPRPMRAATSRPGKPRPVMPKPVRLTRDELLAAIVAEAREQFPIVNWAGHNQRTCPGCKTRPKTCVWRADAKQRVMALPTVERQLKRGVGVPPPLPGPRSKMPASVGNALKAQLALQVGQGGVYGCVLGLAR